ncbi:MAG: DNA polymerase III subunit gamma/tau, partial [Rikenellaceae bacterium]
MEKFVVSARKYRPITFESVVGQEHITSTLRNAIERKQVAHAYLFCGPRGVGKTTCARILSKSLNCLSPLPGAEACGECESCKAFNENRSFNIHELDAASNNSVEYIRSLNDQVRIPPQIGKYSIYIIDEAHMLSTAAFNAFLKTLEEPPAHAIFILATTEKHKILPTILSRCQIYDFKRIKVEDMVRFLGYISSKEGVTYDDDSLHIIAQKADGCMRDALSMYDKVVSFCGNNLNFKDVAEAVNVLDYDSYFKFTDSITSGDYKAALIQFDEILQKGFDAMTFLGGLATHLRNLLVAADSSTIALLEVTGSLAERYKKQAVSCNPSHVFDALNIISQAEGAARFSLNIRLLAELTILKLSNLSPIKISAGSIDQTYTLPKITSSSESTASAQPVQPAQPAQQPAPKPQQVAPPQPTIKQEIPKPIEPPKQESPKQERQKSLLGMSISSMLQKQAPASQVETDDDEPSTCCTEVDNTLIDPSQAEHIIAGCKRYAEILKKSRPRLATSFEYATIEDGILKVVVPNDILKDEINTNLHSIVSELMQLCNSGNIIID